MNIDKQTFNTLDVLYDDKKWGKRIDPDEWNANFKVLEEGHNELVQKLNQQVTDIDTAIQAVTSDGGQNISVQYDAGTETLQHALDNIVSDINNRYTKLQSDTILSENTNPLIRDIFYNSQTGTFTITKKDGSVITIDTVIEKVPVKFELIEENNKTYLKVTNDDGTFTKTDVTSLFNIYNFTESDTVYFVVDGYGVTAKVKPNSITIDNLSLDAVSTLEGYVTDASNSASDSATSAAASEKSAANARTSEQSAKSYSESAQTAKAEAENAKNSASQSAILSSDKANISSKQSVLSQSYARGGTGTRNGEDTDNSKYYMEQAKQAAIQASGFDYQGVWDSSISYIANQLVSYNYTLWCAKQNNINSIPYEGSVDWDIFVGIPSVLDMGTFTDTTLFAHMLNANAHSNATIDANSVETTTDKTLEEHEIDENAHSNIIIDGGGN